VKDSESKKELPFRRSGPNLIECEEGFSVEVLGRTGIRYREGERTMSVDSELLSSASPAGIAVWKNSIVRWLPPFENETISEAKRLTILENIRRAIQFAGDDIEVIG
jgi:hypothetical protein